MWACLCVCIRRISRGEFRAQESEVHFFPTHFMTALEHGGHQACWWTAQKHIDVFKKQLIFLPIHADHHWSLCVIVNPGRIANNYNDAMPETVEHAL